MRGKGYFCRGRKRERGVTGKEIYKTPFRTTDGESIFYTNKKKITRFDIVSGEKKVIERAYQKKKNYYYGNTRHDGGELWIANGKLFYTVYEYKNYYTVKRYIEYYIDLATGEKVRWTEYGNSFSR